MIDVAKLRGKGTAIVALGRVLGGVVARRRETGRALLHNGDKLGPTHLWLLPSEGTRPGLTESPATVEGRFGSAWRIAETMASQFKGTGDSSSRGSTTGVLMLDEIMTAAR